MTTASLPTRFGSYPLIMAAVIAAVGVAPDAPGISALAVHDGCVGLVRRGVAGAIFSFR